jgi:hypothetical protein
MHLFAAAAASGHAFQLLVKPALFRPLTLNIVSVYGRGATRGLVLQFTLTHIGIGINAGLRSSIFRRGHPLHGYGCGELVFDSQGANGLSIIRPASPMRAEEPF